MSLRTPTQSILTFANLLKYDINKNDSIDAIHRNAQRLNVLIKNILDVTKIESNKLLLHQQNFNLNDLLTTIIRDYTTQLKKLTSHKKRIKLHYIFQNEVLGRMLLFTPIRKELFRLFRIYSITL